MAVQVAEVFTNNMVLQQNKPVNIWGTGTPGEKVTVSFEKQKVSTLTDNKGHWLVALFPMKWKDSPQTLEISGQNTIILENVLVGEVWLCSGQSNMHSSFFNMFYESKFERPKDAEYPNLRFYHTPCKAYDGQPVGKGEWKASSYQNIEHFSAVGFYFARTLHKKLNIPVGIIVCAWGGTYAESWMSREQLKSFPEGKTILDKYNQVVQGYGSNSVYEAGILDYQTKIKAWVEKRDKGENPGVVPEEPIGPKYYRRPAGIYYTMLQPLVPFTLKGFVFYQGESNVVESRSYQYRFILTKLIQNWREDYQQGELPFLNVQLPSIDAVGDWAEMRESQWVGLKDLKNTGLIVTADLGDYRKNWHPSNKEPFGERLSLLARGIAYQEKGLEYTGPIYQKMKTVKNQIILTFEHSGSGLVSQSTSLNDFQICDSSMKFVPAIAEITGKNAVKVYSKDVQTPVAVRYGWSNYFTPSLFNKEGLPAMPFRTDQRND